MVCKIGTWITKFTATENLINPLSVVVGSLYSWAPNQFHLHISIESHSFVWYLGGKIDYDAGPIPFQVELRPISSNLKLCIGHGHHWLEFRSPSIQVHPSFDWSCFETCLVCSQLSCQKIRVGESVYQWSNDTASSTGLYCTSSSCRVNWSEKKKKNKISYIYIIQFMS